MGGQTSIFDNGMLEKISVIFTNIESRISSIDGITGTHIGILVINPSMIIIPIMKLINMFEKINVRENVLNSSILIGNIAIQADIDTCIICFIF